MKGNDTHPAKISFLDGASPLSADHVMDWLDAISPHRNNSNIRTVCMEQSFLDMLSCWSPAPADRFCQEIGKIPSLRVLNLDGSNRMYEQSCPKRLQLILAEAKQLETLVCYNSGFSGTAQEFNDLAASLNGHPALQKVSFESCELHGRSEHAQCIGPILLALQTIPNLKDLTLPIDFREVEDPEDIMETAWNDLCRHPNLWNLTLQLYGSGLLVRQFKETLAILQNNTTLRSLGLKLHASLEATRCCTILGQLLRNNSTLQRLSLRLRLDRGFPVEADPLLPIIQALKDNTTLSELNIHCSQHLHCFSSSTAQKEFLCLLETKNSTLTKLHLQLWPIDERDDKFLWQLEFYLTLNRSGAKRLLQNPDVDVPSECWLDALAKCTKNVPALFCLLSANPALCDTDGKKVDSSSADGKDTGEHKQRPNKIQRTG